jgi:hypothetical protein
MALAYICLPCTIILTPLAFLAQLGLGLTMYGVGEAIYPGAKVHASRQNATLAHGLFH